MKYILLSLLLTGFGAGYAAESIPQSAPTRKPATEFRKGMNPGVFQIGGGLLLDPSQRVRGAASLAWTPTYQFSQRFAVRYSVGWVWRYVGTRDELRVGDFALTFLEKPRVNSPLYGEIGGGFQYWTGDESRKFYPAAKAAFGYQFGDGQGFVKNFQLNYSYTIHDPLKSHLLIGVFTVGF